MRQPDEVGGIETQSCYLVVDDADAHYARTVAAGAEIVLDIKSDGFGRRGYSCSDPQGHIWNFGTYNPWKGRVPASYHTDLEHASLEASRRKTWLKAAAALGVVLAGLGVWWITSGGSDTPVELAETAKRQELAAPVGSPGDGIADAFRADLEAARTAKAESERAAEAARAELDLERTKKEAAQRAAAKLEQELAEQRNALQAAVRGMEEARLELAKARDEKASLEKSLNEGRRAEASPPASSSGQDNPATPASIETSAVETTATAQSSESSAPQAVTAGSPKTRAAVRRSGGRYALRIRRPIATVPRPGQTTYLTELHEVPWPYSVWEPRAR